MRYGSFFRFRSTVRVQIGEPINIGEFIAEHSDLTVAEQMNSIKDILTERMTSSILYIPNDEDYEATYEICAAAVKQQVKGFEYTPDGKRVHPLDAHFAANRATVNQIMQLKEENPEKAAKLLALGREASAIRHKERISLASVSIKYPILSRILKTLFFIVALPYFIPISILTLPIKLLCNFIFTKLKDYAFRNSIRFLVNLVLWPVLMIIYSIIAYIFLPWQWALPLTLSLLPAPVVAHEMWRLFRLAKSDIKLLLNKELRNKYRNIREILFNK